MRSRIGEKYSNSTWFPLFCFFLICLNRVAVAQSEVWAHPGNGQNPNISVLMEGGKARLVLVGSPFQSGVLALDPANGKELWRARILEPISRPGRTLSDLAVFLTHTGTLIALDISDGQEIWRQRASEPLDFAAASPLVIDGSIYTLSEKGLLCRFSSHGERLESRTIDTLWEGRRADFVPMWRDSGGLTFLDQAGRIRSFDLQTLLPLEEERVTSAVGPGLGVLGSEIAGGVFSSALGLVWTSELSGLLRCSQARDGKTLWTAPLGRSQDMYSEDGRLLSVPILSLPPEQKVLVVSRGQGSLFSLEDGRSLGSRQLPSPAVTAPVFDFDRETWWVLTRDHLVAISWQGQASWVKLPLVDAPCTAVLAGDLLLIGTNQGHVYALRLPAGSVAKDLSVRLLADLPLLALGQAVHN